MKIDQLVLSFVLTAQAGVLGYLVVKTVPAKPPTGAQIIGTKENNS